MGGFIFEMTRIAELIVPGQMTPPPRLYHYTSQRGLLGILSSNSLWATRIQYLNDSAEFVHALGLWKEALQLRVQRTEAESVLPSDSKARLKDIFERFREGFNCLSEIKIHVACFSEDGDSLSQWRGYCHAGSGFSLGFDSSQLVEAASAQRCFLAPCIYDPQRQADLVNRLFMGIFEDVGFWAPEKRKDSRTLCLDLAFDFVSLACVLKHPSFREEREWRIVTGEVSDEHPRIGIRESKLILIPYFEFELVKPEERLNLEVVVGPNPEMDLAIGSLDTLLKHKKCLASSRASTVPYREL